MPKFHISRSGKPAQCNARKENCPFGGDEQHYDSKQDAQRAVEENLEKKHMNLLSSSRGENKKTQSKNDYSLAKSESGEREVEPEKVMIVYRDYVGNEYTQYASDIVNEGTLIDPDTGDDMEIIGVIGDNDDNLEATKVSLVYKDEEGNEHTQYVSDIEHMGTLIDPETGDDMEVSSVFIESPSTVISSHTVPRLASDYTVDMTIDKTEVFKTSEISNITAKKVKIGDKINSGLYQESKVPKGEFNIDDKDRYEEIISVKHDGDYVRIETNGSIYAFESNENLTVFRDKNSPYRIVLDKDEVSNIPDRNTTAKRIRVGDKINTAKHAQFSVEEDSVKDREKFAEVKSVKISDDDSDLTITVETNNGKYVFSGDNDIIVKRDSDIEK